MRYAVVTGVVVTALVGALAGWAVAEQPRPTGPSDAGHYVVTSTGLPGLEVGTDRSTLVHSQRMSQGPGDCAPRLPERPAVSPVFDGDELVLLWAEPPLRTPDGVAVGTPVGELRARYPGAEALTAPAGSYRYDGALVPTGEHAYLFLHDGDQVRKLVVGSEPHARLLFEQDFGAC